MCFPLGVLKGGLSRNLPFPAFLFSHVPHAHSPILSLSHTHTHSLTFLLVSAKRFSLLSSPRTLTLLIPGHNKTEPVTSCKDRRQQKKLL